jgi:predicted nucleotidyltransferase
MRYNQPLDGLFFSQSATRVLRLLTRHPEKAYTGRELAAAAGVPHHRAGDALLRLQAEGVVTSRAVGNAYVWQLRTMNIITNAVREVFKAEAAFHAELMLLVRRHLHAGADVHEIRLFGSAARGEERPGSDLDLLVIVAVAGARVRINRALEQLEADLATGYGVRLRPIVYTKAEFRRKASLPLVQNILKEGTPLDVRGGGR